MSEGVDVIIIDDEQGVCDIIAEGISKFYTWGDILCYTNIDEAVNYCLNREYGVAIFVLDVFVGQTSGFYFLDSIEKKFPMARDDTIMITGYADNDIVDMCIASGVNYLIEKPIKPYALQLSVRAILAKYLRFAKKILQDPEFAEGVVANL